MDVEIIAIGNELLLGETVDTNSAHVAARLAAIGARATRVTVVGDDRERIRSALEEARGRARWIVTMGGLGPTRDDLTRPVVAEVLDRPLELDDGLLEELEEKFRRFGYERMPVSNRSQAMVPRGARAIPNPNGTAPGLVIEEEGCTTFVLPGVPGEMKGLLESAVLPALVAALGEEAPVVRSRVIHTVGIGESALAERLEDALAGADPVEVAYLPHLGQVDVRLTASGMSQEEAGRRIATLERAIVERAGAWVYGFDDDTLPGAIGAALRARGWTLAVAESCTAGELGAAITSVAGSSDWFAGGVLAYANEVKRRMLGVPAKTLDREGAVSEATCRAMATGARRALEADVACSITGVAGPGGGTEEKPVGLVWIGVETPDGAVVRRLNYPGDRASVRRRATMAALALLLDATHPGAGDG